jgi:hypothetical protein
MSHEINVVAAAATPAVDEKIDVQHVEDAAVKREAVLETKLASKYNSNVGRSFVPLKLMRHQSTHAGKPSESIGRP